MMDEEELQWQALLLDERDKREAARVLCSKPPMREFGKALRDRWGAIEAALGVNKRALSDERVLNPPPLEILAGLEITASCLAVGKMPGPVAHAISEGRRGAESRERRDIGFAVAYMMAASTTGLEHWASWRTVQGGWPVSICNHQKGPAQLSIVRRAVISFKHRVMPFER
jgi:hypothetical protein